jgi:hypothetical protein
MFRTIRKKRREEGYRDRGKWGREREYGGEYDEFERDQ